MITTDARPILDRLALGFLLALMAIGSLALWTVVPGAALWLASLPDGSVATHLLLALVTVPAGIILAGALLVRLNSLYVRISSSPADEEFTRGPLEWLIVASLVIAVITMVVWMVFIAEDPFPWTTPAP